MYKKISLLALIFVTVAGCVQVREATLNTSFDVNQANKMLEQGNNKISGSALIRQNGGSIVTCAGTEVSLIPATEYAKERIGHIYGRTSGKGYSDHRRPIKFSNTSEAYVSAKRSVICDTQGRFEFENVANGSFYVTSIIMWQVGRDDYNIGLGRQGGGLMHSVTLKGSEHKKIVLAP